MTVNYWAVIIAAIANMVLGALWFGPLFGKLWMKHSNIKSGEMNDSMKKGIRKSYILMTLGSLLLAYILSHFIFYASNYTHQVGVAAGLSGALWAWIGFVVPTSIGTVLWDGKSWTAWILTYIYHLVGMLIMGAILGWWM